jgi:Co/Zn/Cd efflux system component
VNGSSDRSRQLSLGPQAAVLVDRQWAPVHTIGRAGTVPAAIMLTGWNWIDPAVSLLISGVIVWGTWGLLRDSVNLSLDAVPSDITPSAVRSFLEGSEGVERIHDLHIWAMGFRPTWKVWHREYHDGQGDAPAHR